MVTLNSSKGNEIEVEAGANPSPQILDIGVQMEAPTTLQSIDINPDKINVNDDEGTTEDDLNSHGNCIELNDY